MRSDDEKEKKKKTTEKKNKKGGHSANLWYPVCVLRAGEAYDSQMYPLLMSSESISAPFF